MGSLLDSINGYKTLLAAGGLIILGILQGVQGDVSGGLQSILAGLAVIGVRHAVEKTTDPEAPIVPVG